MNVRKGSLGPRSLLGRPSSAAEFWRQLLFGQPIPTQQQEHTRLPKLLALPVFASDAISSVAYATQEILLALGAAGLAVAAHRAAYTRSTWEVVIAICALLLVVAVSYRQTIFAYPSGGGSYIVSKDNLGVGCGLIAAAALLIDYVLTVAVSIASGVQNLLSTPAAERLAHYPEAVCLFFVALLMFANMRGLKESGVAFAGPTYLFILLAYLTVALGLLGPRLGWHLHPQAVNQALPAGYGAATGAFGLFVILRAFANGCSAMTGTEAISNGIPAFRRPESANAAATLTWMAVILGSLFVGISWLATSLHVVYWEKNGQTAPAVIDQLSGAIYGRTGQWAWLYYAMQFATAAILVLAANTSFADFPRLASILAHDRFLPRQFANRGDRLVFTNGIVLLALFAALLIVIFRGNVDRLIPLYALGVFTAFTLSQAGMVVHWVRERGAGWALKAAVNGFGALATALVFTIIGVEKGPQGAWIVIVVAMILILLFRAVHRYYAQLAQELRLDGEAPELQTPMQNTVLVLVGGVHRGIVPALRYARALTPQFQAVYVEVEPEQTPVIEANWQRLFPEVPLVVLESPYRSLVGPLLDYIEQVKASGPDEMVTVVIPEYFTDDWWDAMLHNTAGPLLKLALLGRADVAVVNVRYHIHPGPRPAAAPGAARK